MTQIIFYQIPASEIEFLLRQLKSPYYWNPAHPYLMRWEGHWTQTELRVEADPLDRIAALTGEIVLEGLLEQGLSTRLYHQLINAFRANRSQTLYLVGERIHCPENLFPFVQVQYWPRPDSVALSQFLQARGLHSEALYRATLGLCCGELANLLSRHTGLNEDRLAEAITRYKISKLQGRGITLVPQPDCRAVGMDILDSLLSEISDLLKPEAFAAGLPFPRGVILIGPPGTGKSLFAKNTAARLGLPLLCADWTGLISPLPGESEANLRALLHAAEVSAPCVLFWDDYDKAFASADLSRDTGIEKKLAGMLLTWLQERTASVYTIVTLNRINQIPPELRRRFDRTIFVDLPHEGARYEIFCTHLEKYCELPDWGDRDWKILISEYGECTPDEIGKAVYLAAVRSYRQGRPRHITVEDLLYQRKQFTPANIANPGQIQSIRNHSKFALKASSEDRSRWRVEPDPLFKTMLGR